MARSGRPAGAHNCFGHGTVMVRRDVLERVGGYDETYRFAQDYDLWLRIAEQCEVANLSEFLYCWRKSGSSVSATMPANRSSMPPGKGLGHHAGDPPGSGLTHVHNRAIRRRSTGMIDQRHPDFKNTPVAPGRPGMHYAPTDPGAAPQVSIVTPFFNTGREFAETAHSVFGQSFQQWEWIIVNDASTDRSSLAMLDGYRGRDERIRVIDHTENRGLSAARNTGWRAARSEYIVLLDSDDLLEPTAVEKWFWHLATFPEHAFVKGFGVGFGAQEYLWQRGFHENEAFLEENIVDATSMIRRSVLEQVGGFDESTRGGLEDWDLWLHASLGYWGSTVPEFLNWYRRRAQHTDRWSNLEVSARAAFRDALRSRYPHLWEGGFPRITSATVGAYAPMHDDFPAANRLVKPGRRLLMIVPWFAMGGADKFNGDVIGEVRHNGWEVTVASTTEGDHSWLAEFSRLTPDIFPWSTSSGWQTIRASWRT
ncbi:MAG: glycosyltransferase [Ignavibacteriae bacterium]|nr:glycosyltransferase [Ignavibacteriota bacterium]